MIKKFKANELEGGDYGAYLSLYNNQNKNKNEKDFVKRWSLSEVYRMFSGTELDRRKALDRPLSKLKRDILEQLGII